MESTDRVRQTDEGNDIVLSFNDSLLRESDVNLLNGPHWLNDKIIGFCFEFFEKEKFNHSADKLCLINPDVTQFIKLAAADELAVFLEALHLPTKQFIFLAVNDNDDSSQPGGTHWSLLVYQRNRQEFQHFDSCRGSNSEVAKRLAYKLQPVVHAPMGRMKFIEMDCPQQQNGHDCGVFVVAVAEHLCRELCEGFAISLNDTVNTKSISEERNKIKDLILQTAREFNS